MATDTYTATGSHSWVCPANVFAVLADCEGAGGGGGSGDDTTTGGGGGGGCGGRGRKTIAVSPGTSYTVFVGTGGTGGASAGSNSGPFFDGGNGTASYFINLGTVAGNGGQGGLGESDNAGGAGGTGVGDITDTGANGSSGFTGGAGGTGNYGVGGAGSDFYIIPGTDGTNGRVRLTYTPVPFNSFLIL